MTDYVEKATEMADVIGKCIAGGVSKGSGSIVDNVDNVDNVTQAVAENSNRATTPTLFTAGLITPQVTLSTTLVGGAVMVAGGTLAATSVDVKDGCVDNVEKYYQQQINANVAKTVAAQPNMTPAAKLSAIEDIVKQLATPDQSLNQAR